METKYTVTQDIKNKVIEAKERVDIEAPEIIKELFITPYRYFSFDLWQLGFKSIVDLGCGNGYGTQIMEVYFSNVLGIDKDIVPDKNRLRSNIVNTPLDSKSYDGVFCFEVIEHLEEDKQTFLIEEILRISRRGFVIGSVNKYGPNFINDIEIYKGGRNPYHFKELGLSGWKKLIKRFVSEDYSVQFLASFYKKDKQIFVVESPLIESGILKSKPYCFYLKVLL